MTHWSFAASLPWILVGLLVWAGSAWLSYNNWRRGGRRRSSLLLESLRMVLISALVFTLLRPELVQQIKRTTLPEVAVLFDASGSMKTKDLLEGKQVLTRQEWIEKQKQSQFWKPLEKQGKVIKEDFSAPPLNATNSGGAGTDLSAALETVLEREKNLRAVLLLTDGDWNSGKSPVAAATRYREQDIPIFSVAVGRETPLPDLALENVSAPAYGLFGEEIALPFRVSNHLPREVKTTVTLRDGEQEDMRKEITIPPQGELQDAILWNPRKVGENTLTLQLPVEKDEALPENNQQTFRVAVRVETLKVLVVDSLPRWEYRYLRNALARDPGVEMECMLFHPSIGMGDGKNYISGFPSTKEAISRYDVIFLGDVGLGQGELTDKDLELIKGLVEQQSSGLVFLPGRRGRQQTFLRSPLQDLLPVVLDENKPEGIPLQNESALLLTTAGKRHLLTRFDSDENRNETIWKLLPGFYWSAGVEKSRPGSEVLGVHAALRNASGRLPLLVTRSYGSGKVLFMGTDSAWRWRRGVEDRFHYRFWSQVVRWMAHQRHLAEKQGIRLTFSPEVPQPGDSVFLQGTVFDAGGFPLEEGKVSAKIVSPSGRTERIDFKGAEGGWGVFQAQFTPQEGGNYKVTVQAPSAGRELEASIGVVRPEREKLGQPVNSSILQEISGLTKGASGTIGQLDEIVKQIAVLPEPKPMERRLRLWSDPRWAGFLVLLMGIYWTGRKVAGMV